MPDPTQFEDRLLAELRQIVAERPAPPAAVVTARTPRRARLALAGAGVAAATAVAVVLSTTGDGTSAAYAVEPRADGSVSVEIRSLRDAEGLERALRAAGVPAEVEYAPTPAAGGPGCVEAAPVPARPGTSEGPTLHRESGGSQSGPSTSGPGPGPGAGATSSSVMVSDDGVTFTVDPGSIKPGQEVLITTSDGNMSTVSMAVGKDAAPPCAP